MAAHADLNLTDGKPIIGAPVHFVIDGGICVPAIVTAVDGTDPYKVHLRYFPVDGSYWQLDVLADLDAVTTGTWHAVGVN
jgi:hypothetical protein